MYDLIQFQSQPERPADVVGPAHETFKQLYQRGTMVDRHRLLQLQPALSNGQTHGKTMPRQPVPSSDEQLMDCIGNRNQDCLQQLHERYHALLMNMAMYILRDRSAAEEVVQDIFLAVWQQPDRWDADKGKLTSWLLAITRYTAIDRLRSEQRRTPQMQTPLEKVAHLLQRPGIRQDKTRDNIAILRKLLQQLPKNQQQVIFLAFFRGMTHPEIADQLDIPIGTVKSRIRLGLHKLKKYWRNAVAEPDEFEFLDEP